MRKHEMFLSDTVESLLTNREVASHSDRLNNALRPSTATKAHLCTKGLLGTLIIITHKTQTNHPSVQAHRSKTFHQSFINRSEKLHVGRYHIERTGTRPSLQLS